MPGPYRDDRQALHERLRALQNENADLRSARPRARSAAWLGLGATSIVGVILALGGVCAWWQTRPSPGFVVDQPSADLALPPADLSFDEAMMWSASHPTGRIGRSLTDREVASPLWNRDGFVEACGAPPAMEISTRVAVKYGSAIGVTTITTPRDDRVAGCVTAHIRQQTWPWSSKTEQGTIRY